MKILPTGTPFTQLTPTLIEFFSSYQKEGSEMMGTGNMREEKKCILFWGNTEGNRPLGRPRRKWECNNKMDLKEK